jgi:hypothetical protein
MTDIARLFAEDPLNLTKENIDEIIAYYRTARANFNTGEKAAGSTKKMKEASAPGAKVTSLDLDKLLG